MGDITNLFHGDVDYRKFVPDLNETINKDIDAFTEDYLEYRRTRHINNGQVLPWSKSHNTVWFNAGELVIWHGRTGSMKTHATLQVALGLVKQGCAVHLASMELTPNEIQERLEILASGSSSSTEDYVKHLFQYLSGRMFIFDRVDNVSHEDLFGMIIHSATVLKTDHIFIDNLMMCGTSATDWDNQTKFVAKLSSLAKKYQVCIHLVAHSRKPAQGRDDDEGYSIAGSSNIPNTANKVIQVWKNKEKARYEASGYPADMDEDKKRKMMASPDVTLTVQKNRAKPYFEGVMSFWIVNGQLSEAPNKRFAYDTGFGGGY